MDEHLVGRDLVDHGINPPLFSTRSATRHIKHGALIGAGESHGRALCRHVVASNSCRNVRCIQRYMRWHAKIRLAHTRRPSLRVLDTHCVPIPGRDWNARATTAASKGAGQEDGGEALAVHRAKATRGFGSGKALQAGTTASRGRLHAWRPVHEPSLQRSEPGAGLTRPRPMSGQSTVRLAGGTHPVSIFWLEGRPPAS